MWRNRNSVCCCGNIREKKTVGLVPTSALGGQTSDADSTFFVCSFIRRRKQNKISSEEKGLLLVRKIGL